MKTPLNNLQKEYYIVNIKEGVFNDDIEIFLDGLSGSPLRCSFETSCFVKKVNIMSELFLIGRLEGNFSGSRFNVYDINEEDMERSLMATISYHSTVSINAKPRNVEIYLKNPSNRIEKNFGDDLK